VKISHPRVLRAFTIVLACRIAKSALKLPSLASPLSDGRVAEWFEAPVLKCADRRRVGLCRVPSSADLQLLPLPCHAA
jgi:hypothetical protein